MGQFSVKIYASPGSSLSANQHLNCSISEHRTLQNELKEVESAQKVRQPFFAHLVEILSTISNILWSKKVRQRLQFH
jgi:hypothetical protein